MFNKQISFYDNFETHDTYILYNGIYNYFLYNNILWLVYNELYTAPIIHKTDRNELSNQVRTKRHNSIILGENKQTNALFGNCYSGERQSSIRYRNAGRFRDHGILSYSTSFHSFRKKKPRSCSCCGVPRIEHRRWSLYSIAPSLLRYRSWIVGITIRSWSPSGTVKYSSLLTLLYIFLLNVRAGWKMVRSEEFSEIFFVRLEVTVENEVPDALSRFQWNVEPAVLQFELRVWIRTGAGHCTARVGGGCRVRRALDIRIFRILQRD